MNLTALLNPSLNHKRIFKSVNRELIFFGGAGAGKSYSVADKILLQPSFQSSNPRVPLKLKYMIVRKTLPSLKRTCMELIEKRADQFKIRYDLNKSDYTATYSGDSKIIYQSLDDKNSYEKIKSVTDLDGIWIEELNELTEDAYNLLILRPRGGNGRYKQIISTLNPVGVTSWVYNRFFIKDVNRAEKISTTVDDNPFIEKEYVQVLNQLKEYDENLYRIYRLGEWGKLVGAIYPNYQVVDFLPEKIDEVIYSMDFGFNVPTALLKISISELSFYVEELVYESGLTNTDLIQRMNGLGIDKNKQIFCDSAEPDKIRELCNAGYNSHSSDKEVKNGIDFVKAQKVFVMSTATNLIKELGSYIWKKDKDGNALDEPVKFMDHACDAMRYGIYTYGKRFMNIPLPITTFRSHTRSKVVGKLPLNR